MNAVEPQPEPDGRQQRQHQRRPLQRQEEHRQIAAAEPFTQPGAGEGYGHDDEHPVLPQIFAEPFRPAPATVQSQQGKDDLGRVDVVLPLPLVGAPGDPTHRGRQRRCKQRPGPAVPPQRRPLPTGPVRFGSSLPGRQPLETRQATAARPSARGACPKFAARVGSSHCCRAARRKAKRATIVIKPPPITMPIR